MFLGDHRKNKVSVAFGQESHLALGPLAKAFARDLSGADGDLRLVRMIAAAQRVGAGIDKGLDPVLLVRLEGAPDLVPHRRRQEDRCGQHGGDQGDGDDRAQMNAGDHDHQRRREQQHHGRAEVRLLQHEEQRDQDHGGRNCEVLQGVPVAARVFCKIARQGQRERQLGKLRRLERKGADGEPPLGAHAGFSHDHDEDEHDDRYGIQDIGVAAHGMIIRDHHQEHDAHAGRDPDHLFVEQRGGSACRIGRAVNGGEADERDKGDKRDQPPGKISEQPTVQHFS